MSLQSLNPAPARILDRLRQNTDGSALVEAAIVAPFLIGLMAGLFEMMALIGAYQKSSQVATGVADMVARAEDGLRESQLNDIFLAVPYVADQLDFDGRGRIIVSMVVGTPGNGNRISWQRCGGADLGTTSAFGGEGAQNVSLPGGIVVAENQSVVVTEVFYDYESLLSVDFLSNIVINEQAVFRPRFGALDVIQNDTGQPMICS